MGTIHIPTASHRLMSIGYNDEPASVVMEGTKEECNKWLAEFKAMPHRGEGYWIQAIRLTAAQKAQIKRSAERAALLESFGFNK